MGMWSFVKDSGKKLFGSSAEAAASPAIEHPPPEGSAGVPASVAGQ